LLDSLLQERTMSVLAERKYTCRVSSTLNRDTKQFGKKFLFDNREETCWNSDQGSPQWISLEFQELTSVAGLCLQFQGGFAGKECYVETDGTLKILDFYPEDSNKLQYFYLKERVNVKKIRIAFNSSTDFYGRITLYKLDLYPWILIKQNWILATADVHLKRIFLVPNVAVKWLTASLAVETLGLFFFYQFILHLCSSCIFKNHFSFVLESKLTYVNCDITF